MMFSTCFFIVVFRLSLNSFVTPAEEREAGHEQLQVRADSHEEVSRSHPLLLLILRLRRRSVERKLAKVRRVPPFEHDRAQEATADSEVS